VNTWLKKSLMVALAAAGGSLVAGEPPKAAPAKPAPARSLFIMPANPNQGRDPFFPESNRPYEQLGAAPGSAAVPEFVIKGLSYEHGRPMVIINNHTFAVGDEGDVLSGAGRAHLRLIEIRPGIAVIEVNGHRRELTFATK
jgi:hypothetical protein